PDLLDLEKFKNDLDHRGPEAFRQDLRQSRYLNVGRFPTLTINQPGHSGVMIIGYRPYEVLLQGLKQVVPDIQPVQKIEMTDYKKFWGYVTDRELSEVS
ncbi:MAG TPA: DsbA family protein, partial [Chitinophagaceae bacterium]|nr:DsbA family protein [Chitinophagaceae bacterium]